MNRCWLLSVILCLVAIGCHRTPSQQSDQGARGGAPLQMEARSTHEYFVGEPIRYKNLAIFPVSSRQLNDQDRFITLDEGLKDGSVEIFEMGAARPQAEANPDTDPNPIAAQTVPAEPAAETHDHPAQQLALQNGAQASGNEVNQLLVLNKSDKPLYLMPGEIIMGGSQDRTIGRELVIQPGEEPVPINVFCVEHGRWGGRADQDTVASLAMATSNSLRESSVTVLAGDDLQQAARRANDGKFIASVGNLSKGARLAVQESSDQGKVWEEVARENARSSVKHSSGAFTANYFEEQAVTRLEPYIDKLQQPVAATPKVVGVVVAVNGQVETLDVFESTPLFQKLWPKLLKSYALDAANAAEQQGAQSVCSQAEARKFLDDAMHADVEQSEVQGALVLTKRAGEQVVTFAAGDAASDESSGFGGFGGGVHISGFSK